jgi:4-alpha-glucanotransferase
VGDLGPAAHALLDWLVDAGLSVWQLLPLGPTGYGDSPYHAHSSFAGNPLLVSPEALLADGLLAPADLAPFAAPGAGAAAAAVGGAAARDPVAAASSGESPPAPDSAVLAAPAPPPPPPAAAGAAREPVSAGRVDYAAAHELKRRLLWKAREAFAALDPDGLSLLWKPLVSRPNAARGAADSGESRSRETRAAEIGSAAEAGEGAERAASLRRAWRRFAGDPSVRAWLDDWTLYAAVKEKFGGGSWVDWEPELRDRRRGALAAARRELRAAIELAALAQFLFFRQWSALRAAADARGIELLGDLPIYPALDSAEVWADRRLFQLARDGRPRRVAGVPPDYFSRSGQLWGNPLYRWDRLAASSYRWWSARVAWQLRLFHRLRLDHFRGFVAYWDVPAGAETAAAGRWIPGPGRALFDALGRALGDGLPLLAEDLGEIDAPVHALRRRLGLPGMCVLQFAFDATGSLHAPHRHPSDAVVYTGTHDNDTCRGWLATAPAEARRRALVYLGANEEGFPWAMVRAAMTSPARLAIAPLQDLLGLGAEARMNTPAREAGNWTWRVRPDQVPPELPGRIRELVEISGRAAKRERLRNSAARPAAADPGPAAEQLLATD